MITSDLNSQAKVRRRRLILNINYFIWRYLTPKKTKWKVYDQQRHLIVMKMDGHKLSLADRMTLLRIAWRMGNASPYLDTPEQSRRKLKIVRDVLNHLRDEENRPLS